MDFTNFTPDDIIVSVLVLAIFTYTVRATYKGIKNARENDLDAGVVFGDTMMSQEGLIMKILVGIFLAFEAGLTAYYHNNAGMSDVYAQSYEIPVAIKFGIHFLFAIGGFVLTYTTPKKWIHFLYVAPTELLSFSAKKRKVALAKRRKEGINGTDVLLSLFNAVFNSILAIALPIVNVYLLAIASRQSVQVQLFLSNLWYNIFGGWLGGISSEQISTLPHSILNNQTTESIGYQMEGVAGLVLGPEYNVYGDFLYPLQVMMVTSIVHYTITLGQSVNTFAKDRHAGNTGGVSKKSPSAKDPSKKGGKGKKVSDDIEVDLENSPEDALEEMLGFYGYKDSQLDDKVDSALDALADMDSKYLTDMNIKISTILYSIRKAQVEKLGRDTSRSRSIRRDVHSLFDGKIRRGQGFGIHLSTAVGGIKKA